MLSVRLLPSLLLAGVSALGLLHCSKRANTLDVSPPLPPAEEPRDDVKGVYTGDAGTRAP
jgi:hypothetical protein